MIFIILTLGLIPHALRRSEQSFRAESRVGLPNVIIIIIKYFNFICFLMKRGLRAVRE